MNAGEEASSGSDDKVLIFRVSMSDDDNIDEE